MIKLFGNQVWNDITAELADATRTMAAVAYVGPQAPALLNLGSGDVLVIDGSDQSLKNGTVSPEAIKTWLDAGVIVHTLAGLHAKVVVADRSHGALSITIVGSANASASSRDHLAEACVATTVPEVVEGARQLIDGWIAAAAVVDQQWLKRAYELYRTAPPAPKRSKQPLRLDRSRVWIGIAEKSDANVNPKVDDVVVAIADQFSSAVVDVWAIAAGDESVVHVGDTLILAPAWPNEHPHGRSYVQPPARVIRVDPGDSRFDAAVIYAYEEAPSRVTFARLRDQLGENLDLDKPITRADVIDRVLDLFGL